MRQELTRWIRATHDVGFLPEADVWARIGDGTPYALARDAEAYPQARITGAAALVGREDSLEEQAELLADPDAAVRYWAAVGLTASSRATDESREGLRAALKDPSAVVRIAAAGALARHAPDPRRKPGRGRAGEADSPDDLAAGLSVLQDGAREAKTSTPPSSPAGRSSSSEPGPRRSPGR